MRIERPVLLLLTGFFLSGIFSGISSAADSSPSPLLPLKGLIIQSDRSHGPIAIPDSSAFRGIDRIRIRFLGSPSYFVGILISARNRSGQKVHHGLFDQGPINEVLSQTFWKTPVLLHIVGLTQLGRKRYLVIEELPNKTETRIPLEKALSVLLAQIGTRKDLVWGAN